MELKPYQRHVIGDLREYLDRVCETKNYVAAFRQFWEDRHVPALGFYNDVIPGVPCLCFKVPTGGGKTFIACNAIKNVFNALPMTKTKAVVWLVPSDAILTQTVKALKDTSHPYRQKIDVDFGSRVEVYTKEELLNGQNFSPVTVSEQLSIMVLSYDSFRGRGKDVLKAYQENSNLAEFAKVLGKPDAPIAQADESALFQVINQLCPLVIVDESHHARSELSLEMLKNFNPSFVLDLTATPKKESNIISYVDAVQLKSEHMVKLPVIVYNRDNVTDVVTDAIDLRNRLEELAKKEEATSGKYIRPITLFQAQPKGKEDATTFAKLKEKLVEAGIKAEEIAIRTAEVNELKHVDLMSRDCPVRYIITVNALKEGWDCPFAYILASLANKTSPVEVEQILGRILRLPWTRDNEAAPLNMSYVLTSSNDFGATVKHIVKGLNNAGFSDKDFRSVAETGAAAPEAPSPKPEQGDFSFDETGIASFDSVKVGETLRAREEAATQDASSPIVDVMLAKAQSEGDAYHEAITVEANDSSVQNISWEVREKVTTYSVRPQFAEEIKTLKLPQFFVKEPANIFMEEELVLLEKEHLTRAFSLKGQNCQIDFSAADDEIVRVDVNRGEGGVPKVYALSASEQQYMKEMLSSQPEDGRLRVCRSIIYEQLNKINTVSAKGLKGYVEDVFEQLDREQLAAVEKSPGTFANKIKQKIEALQTEYAEGSFDLMIQQEHIVCEPSFVFPQMIHLSKASQMFGKSLYEAEEEMNGLEQSLVVKLTGLSNIRWWHRNRVHYGFCLNGCLKHYPDLVIKTENGKIILVETKGGYLANDDSREKLKLGKAWCAAAGKQYRYFMVFKDGDNQVDGGISVSDFMEIIKAL